MNKNPTVIRMKFVRPIGQNEDNFFLDLQECGKQCDEARNAGLRYWQRWREDNDWLPDEKVDENGKLKRRKNGDVIYANLPAPKVDGVTFSTAIYRRMRIVRPELSSSIVSLLSGGLWKRLRQKAKFVPGNTALYEWQAILEYEVAASSFRSRLIPVPNGAMNVGWGDCCWVEFPLWSRGRAPGRYKVECKVSDLPSGKKRLLQMAIAGELKINDSHIVRRSAKDWSLHLFVMTESEASNLDVSRILRIDSGDRDSQRPFLVTLPDDTVVPVGAGIPLKAEHERLTIRRKAIRASKRMGAMKGGHGERRFYAKVTSESRRYGGVQSAFHRTVADDIYRLCIRENCGTVEYYEPPVKDRKKTWFGVNDVPFDWTLQRSRIVGKLKRRSIDIKVIDAADTTV